ncbi:hypothetical protein WJX77_004783 [Trebouxia sp. C0004]
MLVKPTMSASTFGARAPLFVPIKQMHIATCRQRLAFRSPARRVTLEFETSEGPKTIECDSGDILRDVMLEQKIDLYTTWGKIWTCGGNGQCGTCVVEVVSGDKLLSKKNDTEENKLKRKPESYRLACQTNVGNGSNKGTIGLKTKPP